MRKAAAVVLLMFASGCSQLPAAPTEPEAVHTGTGEVVYRLTEDLDQEAVASEALSSLTELRTWAWQDNVPFEGVSLRDYLRSQGVDSLEAYTSSVSWDSDMEKAALQRAAEAGAVFSHTRPDGSPWSTATVGESAPQVEVLTSLDDVRKAMTDHHAAGSWAAESAALQASGGRMLNLDQATAENQTGHLHALLDPRWRCVGFAKANGVVAGELREQCSKDTATPTGHKGSFTFQITASRTSSQVMRKDRLTRVR